jgi:hypothetical protein
MTNDLPHTLPGFFCGNDGERLLTNQDNCQVSKG